ncbi:MAG: PIN domain-containing protein [Patescibacteria group bacterium]
MKIYLDNSFLNRPFDDPAVAQNRLEGEILFSVMALVERNELDLIHSAVIAYENALNPFPDRRAFIAEFMERAVQYQDVDDGVYRRASALVKKSKIRPIDALHIAAAEAAGVDLFLTCDYSLLRKYKGAMRATDPLSFMTSYEKHHQ